ncbi:MAG: holo-[acyl-carrier-protein] synthase [Deltaproteobacteria bacterium]|nr:holo-[acyl-carrier-protein] synthase [Deltaproteobacteria bacterium]
MVIGTGVDLAEIDRIERALAARHGERFRTRVYTAGEQRYCESRGRGRAQSYAARFAAKEAVMKALGVGWGRHAAWHEIEVVRARAAAPHVVLSGAAAETARRLGIVRWSLSLTHAANLAVAFVVAEGAGA